MTVDTTFYDFCLFSLIYRYVCFQGFFLCYFYIIFVYIFTFILFTVFVVVACNRAFEQGHLEPMLLLLVVNNESRKEKKEANIVFVVCSGDVSQYNKELLTTVKRGQDPMKNGGGCVRFSTTTSVALGQGTDDDDDGMLSEHKNCCVCGYFRELSLSLL